MSKSDDILKAIEQYRAEHGECPRVIELSKKDAEALIPAIKTGKVARTHFIYGIPVRVVEEGKL